MLVVKALHIWMVISWFAGLFYLPRIFVNLAMVPPDSTAERDRLLLMAGKLYKFMTPLGVLAVALGFWLWFGYGFGAAGCMPRRPWSGCWPSIIGIAAGY
jgi:putative membrane protein